MYMALRGPMVVATEPQRDAVCVITVTSGCENLTLYFVQFNLEATGGGAYKFQVPNKDEYWVLLRSLMLAVGFSEQWSSWEEWKEHALQDTVYGGDHVLRELLARQTWQ